VRRGLFYKWSESDLMGCLKDRILYKLMNSMNYSACDCPLCVTYTRPNQVTELKYDTDNAHSFAGSMDIFWFYDVSLLPWAVELYTSSVFQLQPSSTSSTLAVTSIGTSSNTYSVSTLTTDPTRPPRGSVIWEGKRGRETQKIYLPCLIPEKIKKIHLLYS
jgi:hypothetical protein